MTAAYIGKDGLGTFRTLALGGPCKCLNDDRIERLFRAIISTRKTGKVSFNIFQDTLNKLGTYGPDVIVAAVDIYLEKQEREGGYPEKYLIGIARGEAKRNGHQASKPAERPALEEEPKSHPGVEYLRSVIVRLRELYVEHESNSPEARAIVTAGHGLYDLADKLKLGQIMAGEVDAKATLIEFSFREAVPGVGIPRFSPYELM